MWLPRVAGRQLSSGLCGLYTLGRLLRFVGNSSPSEQITLLGAEVSTRQIDLAAARKQALESVDRFTAEQSLGELVLIEDGIIETSDACHFRCGSAAFVSCGGIYSALAGNIPVGVARDGKRRPVRRTQNHSMALWLVSAE